MSNKVKGKKSVTPNITKQTEQKQESQIGKVFTVDHTGRPSYGKIVTLRGYHSETEIIRYIVPLYQECTNCGLYLGHLEVKFSDELDKMCLDCFRTEIGEINVFSGTNITHIPCKSCGLDMERGKDLFSKLKGCCNHCYLRIANLDEGHSCIHCDPKFPLPKKLELLK